MKHYPDLRKKIKNALTEIAQPNCFRVTAKTCVGASGLMTTNVSKCATLDSNPVTLQDMGKVIKFGNNNNIYKIIGISINPGGIGTDDINTTNNNCGCDSSMWSGLNNWIGNWTNNGAFQNLNNNPNQPCNHICQRKQLWTSQYPNVGPIWANKLICKLEEVENQIQINGCNC